MSSYSVMFSGLVASCISSSTKIYSGSMATHSVISCNIWSAFMPVFNSIVRCSNLETASFNNLTTSTFSCSLDAATCNNLIVATFSSETILSEGIQLSFLLAIGTGAISLSSGAHGFESNGFNPLVTALVNIGRIRPMTLFVAMTINFVVTRPISG